jgi:dihydrofolate reductase
MGRKTWESLQIKPLPKRRNIVLSSNNINEVECYSNVDELMDNVKYESSIFIIGGAQIYNIFYPMADELHISFINKKTPNIDVFFPIKISDIEKKYNKTSSKNLNHEVVYTKWIKK